MNQVKEKIKLLIDASITSVGGGLQVALAFIENIAKDPEFEVICIVNPQIDQQLSAVTKTKLKHYYVESTVSMPFKFLQGFKISKIEKKHKPDFVFVVFGPAYWKPRAPTLQGFALGKMLYQKELKVALFEKILNFIKAKLFLMCDSFLVVETELVKQKLSFFLNYDPSKIFVIGNSFSPSFLYFLAKANQIEERESEYFQILVPCSYYPHKNLERLICSLVFFKEKHSELVSKLKLLFTIPKESAEWLKLYNLAKNNGVEAYIDSAGFIPNSKFARLYISSQAVICASLVESSTAVFPEAFLSKRPLLVSKRDFATELCGDAALYFDPLDEENIADAIFEIMTNASLRDELVKRGIRVLHDNYPSAQEKWIMQKNLLLSLSNREVN
ncbi:glycosyltransferase [Acinetobacter sp. YH16057]|uniref:glycosyltransferase n=1 Tax=Acinetobacter sp. YH16057 TaxID=2601195 RepID=UPI0015D1A78F|nr:glycosyltransferase [Acinetobacter sp. YH16057]